MLDHVPNLEYLRELCYKSHEFKEGFKHHDSFDTYLDIGTSSLRVDFGLNGV